MTPYAISTAEFIAIPGGVLALLGICAVVWRLFMAAHRAASRLERIEEMAKELKPNGGGSIKDQINRIDKHVKHNTEVLADHSERIAKNEGRVEAIALVTSPTMLIEDDEGVIRESRKTS